MKSELEKILIACVSLMDQFVPSVLGYLHKTSRPCEIEDKLVSALLGRSTQDAGQYREYIKLGPSVVQGLLNSMVVLKHNQYIEC